MRHLRVEVDVGAAQANYAFFRRLAMGAETAAVVKADAYGLGAAVLAPAFARAGARTFFVATPQEGAAVRAALNADHAIYVLGGYTDDPAWRAAALRPVLNTLVQARAWRDAGRPGGVCALHVDTGMNRLGLPMTEVAAAAALDLAPDLVMSHLACASDPAHPMNARQRSRFLDAAALFPDARKSLSSSAGALIGPNYAFDLIRPGIGLYGGAPLDAGGTPLSPVARASAPILQVRTIEAGDTVGYAAAFVAERAMQIVTLGAGYADGLLRSLSSRGYAVVAGERRPILGRVSMDLISVDATGLSVAPGDLVDLIGPGLGVDEVAATAGTAPYEILTQLVRAPKSYRGGA